MSTYRKEKNLIIISLDGVNGEYSFDINTGVFYGLKGKPIKTCPHRPTVQRLFHFSKNPNATNLSYLLHTVFIAGDTTNYPCYVEALQSADKLDALGAPLYFLNDSQYIYIGKNLKAFLSYTKDHSDDFSYRNFNQWSEFEKAKKKYGAIVDTITAEMYSDLVYRINNLTTEELSVCAYYLGRGKLWEYSRGQIRPLVEYIDFCRAMGKEPQKVNNFMREYCETKKAYELRKAEYDNKKIVENYAKQSKAWEFAYGDCVVVIPTTAQDIISEGEKMHHCVGSYVDRVVNNNTYICFIRHKDTPDIPYITCQVHEGGHIGQYYLAYDRFINSEEDKEFKKAFAEHLANVWNK